MTTLKKVKKWWWFLVLFLVVFFLLWPGGMITGWGWGWFHHNNSQSTPVAIPVSTEEPVATPDIQALVDKAVAEALASLPTQNPQPIPTQPTPVQQVGTETQVSGYQVSGDLPTELYISPVGCVQSFNAESSWMICEPGVLLDASTAWTIPATKDIWYSNDPEGAFAYYSLGQGKITVDGYTLDLPYVEGHNYLVLIRGRIDDGKVDTDRNLTAEVTDFVPGHAIWSHMPTGAYVSKDWFMEQLIASTTTGFTNCGAIGCSHITVVLFDIDTHFEQRFAVEVSDLSSWTQIK